MKFYAETPMKKQLVIFLAIAALVCRSRPAFADEVDDLLKRTESTDVGTSYTAFRSLGSLKEPKAVDALLRILEHDPDRVRRENAVDSLYDFNGPRDPRSVEPLIRSLDGDSETSVRSRCAYALGELGAKDPKALVALREALGHADMGVREKSAEALGKLADAGNKDENALTALIALLKNDPAPSVRSASAMALRGFKDERVIDALMLALKDEAGLVRAFSASSLGLIGDKRAIEPVRSLLGDPEETVRGYAATTLNRLGATGEAAAQGGDLRGALTQYLAEVQNSVYESEPRRKVIALVAKLDPKPALPEEAQRAMARGKVEFENVRSAAQWAKPAGEFQTAANLAPWWPDAYFNLAMTQEKQKDYYHSIENLKLYLEASPNATDTAAIKEKLYQLEYKQENAAKCDELIQRAADVANAGQPAQAIPILQEALAADPESSRAHANLGRAYEQLERFKEAISELKEGIRLGETDMGAFWSLAYCYDKAEENYDEAILVTEEGIRLNLYSAEQSDVGPMIASMYRNLGYYYEKKANYKKAIECYETAIAKGHSKADEIRQGIERIRPYAGS